MPKIDLKRENKALYDPYAKEVSIVDVPEMKFLMIDGKGDPNTSSTSPTGSENHLSPLRFQTFNRKYFEIGMKLNDFSIQLVKYWIRRNRSSDKKLNKSLLRFG